MEITTGIVCMVSVFRILYSVSNVVKPQISSLKGRTAYYVTTPLVTTTSPFINVRSWCPLQFGNECLLHVVSLSLPLHFIVGGPALVFRV